MRSVAEGATEASLRIDRSPTGKGQVVHAHHISGRLCDREALSQNHRRKLTPIDPPHGFPPSAGFAAA